MKIIILDTLINQYENREVATNSLKRIDKELRNLANIVDHGRQAVIDYLVKGNDGKPFHGIKNNARIYKYDLTDGDRILYVHGSDLSYLSEDDKDSFVLVSYAPHDFQEKVAKRGNFFQKHNYVDVKFYKEYVDVVVEGNDLTEKECSDIAVGFFGGFKAYEIDIDDIENLSANDLDKRVVLTPEQRTYFEEWEQNPVPTLLTGGAGTGKTILAIRMLESFEKSRQNQSAVYFTQSQELRKNGKKQLCSLLNVDNKDFEGSSIETQNKNVFDFFNINDYCIEKLGLNDFDYVRFQEFENDFCINNNEVIHLCQKAGLSFFEVWIDIRGVIKGSLNEYWQRRMSVSQFDYSNVDSLVKKGFLVRLESDPQRIKLPGSVRSSRKLLPILSGAEKSSYEKIILAFETIDTSMHMITLDDYLSVSDEISVFTSDQRKCVYKICELYQQWLGNSRMDENDLVMSVLNNTVLDQYDLVVVDEVQDYTELQIFLIYNLCSQKNAFVFAGDIHQVINPTVFNHERLKKLFLNEAGNETLLRVRALNSNYRCQQGIVNSVNKLSELRRKIVGRKDVAFEKEETSHDPMVISSPFRVLYNDDNLKAMLYEIMKYPRVGVLVVDDDSRQKLIKLIGEQVYKDYDIPFIFTISEIKGMEYQYIVCIDMFSHYNQEWEQILADNMTKKRKTKHRFYFNLAYVALTRAQLHICFVDQNPVQKIDEVLGLEKYSVFNAEDCRFTDLGTSLQDWYEQAKLHRENGNYSTAIKYYQKSGDYACPQDFYSCYIGEAEINRDYVNLIKYALLNSNLSLALKYVGKSNIPTVLKDLVNWFDSPVEKTGIIKLINKNFKDFSKEDCDRIYTMAREKLREETIDVLGLSIAMEE
jgi:hypothetical protein